ncbi:MAG: hypothetical protein IPK05_17640 [Comamonadaceae bacterium]|nr:hypothetical protein [Comamonadaceae bacterium]
MADLYVVAHTPPTETVDGMVSTPGTINGGFSERKPGRPAHSVSRDHRGGRASARDAAACGGGGAGGVVGEPMEIPGIGQYVSFMDTEGNRVSMLQPLTRPA